MTIFDGKQFEWGMVFFALVTRVFFYGDWYRGFPRELEVVFCNGGSFLRR